MKYLNQHHQSLPVQPKVLSRVIHQLFLGSLVCLPLHSVAQTAEEQNVEVISVTGSYSKSLEKAVDLKQSNIGFSDSIVATDIADFPEQNLAEALQRMPGV
ncbi:MAG: iron complex outermembrane receptor protein, partial [Rheinheimera aquimaris]